MLQTLTGSSLNTSVLRLSCPEAFPFFRDLVAAMISFSSGRVRTGPGKPGKSWNFIMAFSRTGKSWKKATGPGKFWKSVNLN